jgi:N utilization substance protein B
MPSRYRSRQHALQILYLWDMRPRPVEQAMEEFFSSLSPEEGQAPPQRDAFTEELVRGVSTRVEEIDRQILERSDHWRLDRMSVVDRNILRLAVYEMIRQSTPPVVVIDQALELARRFSGEESVAFVNGLLDAVRRGLAEGESA